MGERERVRCRERIEKLVEADLGPEAAQRAAIDELRRAVGFERWCWPLTDPGTGLAMGGVAEFDLWPVVPRLAALEEQEPGANKPRLILGSVASAALSTATDGDLSRSRRWRECLQPYGIGDELMTVCRDRNGCWGSVELMRDSGDPLFREDEARLLHDLAPVLGALLRRSAARSWQVTAADPEPRPPGTLILDERMARAGWTSPVRDWLADLSPGAEMLPPGVYEIAARVRTPPGAAHGLPARVRIRTRSGRWSVVEGARLEGEGRGRVAVTIRAAAAEEVFDVLCRAHDLTARERQLATLLRKGLATKGLAGSLSISPYTVQDHLKAIFAKTGARSRGELLSRLAGSHAHDGRPSD
ncbi:MAG TPA: helix-turn-helix transcriptional regulator [Vicinamibacterales bacterium]